MANPKKFFGKRVLSGVLAFCMVFTSLAPTVANVAYADELTSSTVQVVGGEASLVTDADSVASEDATSEAAENASSSVKAEDNSSASSEAVSEDDSSSPDSQVSEDASSSQTTEEDKSSVTSDSTSQVVEEDANQDDSSSSANSEAAGEGAEEESKADADAEEMAEEEFLPLAVVDPENTLVESTVGDEVTLTSGVNREDVAVEYQWQRMQLAIPTKESAVEPLHNYPEKSPTWYSFPMDDMTEAEALAQNPDATWSGIETYYAVVEALGKAGADNSNVSLAWQTPNYALNGYIITAEMQDGAPVVYAEKDGQQFVAVMNSEGQFEFSTDAQAAQADLLENVWVDVEGATEPTYTFAVDENDLYAQYRLVVKVVDEEYLAKCLEILEEQGVELTEEQKAEPQVLYSVVVKMSPVAQKEEPVTEEQTDFVAPLAVMTPTLSADGQWIEGLTGYHQYITKDTYERVRAWVRAGEIKASDANLYWTSLNPKGWGGESTANILNAEGKPTGQYRIYNGFNLTDGDKLEVASEWYGKTVLFRIAGTTTITEIKIPAYTEISGSGNGYDEAASGTKYKKAVVFLNPFPNDTPPMYETYLNLMSNAEGWLKNQNDNTKVTDVHVTVHSVNVESFNADPERFMVDAEGNYRVDSVGWGVCTSDEPDISGKAYWVLKDFIANGYGFLTGHDTMYAYAGAYYDALGKDLDESSIDPNDGTTWYYNLNSWLPGTTGTSSNGQTSTTRGGHFYLNELMGTNAGNVYSGTVTPDDAPSQIISTGGSHGKYGKQAMYGTETLNVLQLGFSAATAQSNPRYRTPTNYPYVFQVGTNQFGETFTVPFTHTNGQAAFGTLWVNYSGKNLGSYEWGAFDDPLYWTINGQTGTNNFYLTGQGNYLMNQIGHLPTNSASARESMLFANSVMYVSQRKQCEVCAANQHGQETSHFVRRVSNANLSEVLTALQNGGSYWYPLDGCYQLTEDITLPAGFKPIENFSGHWNSDVYEVNLNGATALLKNDAKGNENSWNLGTDQNKGVDTVFNAGMKRTTGVARVVGDLNDLFGTSTSYAGYTVKFLYEDNKNFMSAGQEFSCTVNTDNKYVVSNLPCVYDASAKTGILKARVYDAAGKEVTKYGTILANVPKSFWNTDMTTPLYLGSFDADPVGDYTTYESAQAIFTAVGYSSDTVSLKEWQYSSDNGKTWKSLDGNMNKVVSNSSNNGAGGLYALTSKLTLTDVDPNWNGYLFRAVFTAGSSSWNTYEYYRLGGVASNTPITDGRTETVYKNGFSGKLTVLTWPVYTQQGADIQVMEGKNATFTSLAILPGDNVTAQWEHRAPGTNTWVPVTEGAEYSVSALAKTSASDGAKNDFYTTLSKVASGNDKTLFLTNANFTQVKTTLTVKLADLSLDGSHYRVKYVGTTKFGTAYVWYSDLANEKNGAWNTDSGSFGIFSVAAKANNSAKLTVVPPQLDVVTTPSWTQQDTVTPDAYGQLLTTSNYSSTVVNGTAYYKATIYYNPAEIQGAVNASWQYFVFNNPTPKTLTSTSPGTGYITGGISITESAHSDVTSGEYKGWKMFTSTLAIKNPDLKMYQVDKGVKYFFRCVANASYTTSKGAKVLTAADKWGGLVLDYKIAIWHNGFLEYNKTNVINGATVNSSDTLYSAINGKSSSTWRYPELQISNPGSNIRTVVVWLEGSGLDTSDTINVSDIPSKVKYKLLKDGHQLIMTGDLSNSAWESILRNNVTFTTNNTDANFAANSGGITVKWYINDQLLLDLDSVTFDPSTGKAYRLIQKSGMTWNEAKQLAEQSYGLFGNGKLVEINSGSENTIVKNLLGGKNAWIGAKESAKHTWSWVSGGSISIGSSYWKSGINLSNRDDAESGAHHWGYVYMEGSTGKWSVSPQVVQTTKTETTVVDTLDTNRTKTWGDTNESATGVWPWGTGINQITVNQSAVLSQDSESEHSADMPSLLCWDDSLGAVHGAAVSFNEGNLESGAGNGVREVTAWVHIQVPANTGIMGDQGATTTDAIFFERLEECYAGETGSQSWQVGKEVWKNGAHNYFRDFYNGGFNADGTGLQVLGKGTDGTLNWVRLKMTIGSHNSGASTENKDTIKGFRLGGKWYGGWSGNMIITLEKVQVKYTKGVKTTTSKVVPVTNVTSATISYAVAEYDALSFGVGSTAHSAGDDAIIGTSKGTTPVETKKTVSVKISDNSKVYDKTAIYPATFTVSGSEGASIDMFNVTYTPVDVNNLSGYKKTTLTGNKYKESGAINTGVYIATLTLKSEYSDWVLDAANSDLEATLTITPRQVDVKSVNNDKVYDGTSSGTIKNIQIVSGVVAGDTVNLTATTVAGGYLDADGKPTSNQSNGTQLTMARNKALSPLDVSHTGGSDPYCNYVLGTETYSGAIAAKGLKLHSLYLEEPEYPRNVKVYDGTNAALISNIVVDGVVNGDTVALDKESYAGTYATANAGETLTADGKVQPDRRKKLSETEITRTEAISLVNNPYGNYYIASEDYSGGILRAGLEVRVSSYRYMYGSDKAPGYPVYDKSYSANTVASADSWMKMDGLQNKDVLNLDSKFTLSAKDKNGTAIEFTNRTSVGSYEVKAEGLTEANYPLLKNYFVNVYSGLVEVYAREIVITVADTDWYTLDSGIPLTHALFEMMNDDEETYTKIGDDAEVDYSGMKLIGNDTIQNTLLVGTEAPSRGGTAAIKEFGSDDERCSVFTNGSNIPYQTAWYNGAPAIYPDLTSDLSVYPCEWCEEYHGFELGTDHWKIGGYKLGVNQDATKGDTLSVKQVENPLGEMVENYSVRYVDGQIRVHPELRFQLEATVPLQVCMYAYAGDGEVVEPVNYGITNYSNGAIEIVDIKVGDDGWDIVDKPVAELLRGEMTMRMKDTQLTVGNNSPRNPGQWVIEADKSDDNSGVEMLIPMACYIAGGNVNERQEVYVAHVTYTIAEHGITLPEVGEEESGVPGFTLPDFVDGEPVTVVEKD